MVIALAVADEAMIAAEHLPAGQRDFQRTLLSPSDRVREILGKNVEHPQAGVGVHLPKLGGHGERQNVHRGLRGIGKLHK